MQTPKPNYLAAYRSLRLVRDANGVLVVEFPSNGGPFRFTTQDHTETYIRKSRNASAQSKHCKEMCRL